MGIDVYSHNKIIPNSCKGIVPPKATKAIRFCIGRELFNLPIGLIIYAGRNQYNHWNDDPYNITFTVFNILSVAHYHDIWHDLAYELSNLSITIYAQEILIGALMWLSYEDYFNEMKELLVNNV